MNTPLTWRQADHDVYVATHDGEYAGFVTVEDASHILHDRHSRRIGSYPSLSAARSALDALGAASPKGAPAPAAARRPASTRPRRRRARAVVS